MLVEARENLPAGFATKPVQQPRVRPCKLRQGKCVNYDS